MYHLPVRGHAVTGRVLGCVGVMEVCHAFVGIITRYPTGVGTRHERNRAPHLQLGLEGERLIAAMLSRRGPIVHQEQRHRAGPRRNPTRKIRAVHRTGDRVQDQTARARYALPTRIPRSPQRHPDRLFAWRTLPPRRRRTRTVRASPMVRTRGSVGLVSRRSTVGVEGRVPDVVVVTPADRDVQSIDPLGDQKAQADRRREEAPLRWPAVFRGVVAQPRLSRDLRVKVLVRIGVRPLHRRRPPRNQKTGEKPARRPHPSRQALRRRRMPGPRANQIEFQRLPQAGAHVSGRGHGADEVTAASPSTSADRHSPWCPLVAA